MSVQENNPVVEAARETNDHPLVRGAARVGYVASGIIHLLIAYLALRVALTPARSEADQSGAASTLSELPGGVALLVVLALGFVGLTIWQATEAVSGVYSHGLEGAAGRAKAAAKGVVYVAFVWVCVSAARGLGQSGSAQSSAVTARVMTWPGGPFLVMAAGIAVLGVGVYHVIKGIRAGFMKDLVEDPGALAVTAGRIGYVAKGVALGIVGVLMTLAGHNHRPGSSQGLSGAMAWLERQPFGPYLLGVVAVGIGAYGVYSFFRARSTRV